MGAMGIGLQLTIYGMGLVFVLLAVLAFLIKLLLRSDSAGPPQTAVPEEAPSRLPPGIDDDAMAAILVAVTTHRAVRRKEAAPAMREHWPGTLPSRWVTVGRSLQNTAWQPSRRTK